jgi:hypothetical protein
MSVQTAIKNWLSSSLPLNTPVIVGKQNAPQPAKPFVSFDTRTLTRIGQAETRLSNTAGKQDTFQDALLTVDIKVIGPGAFSLAGACIVGLEKESCRDDLILNRLGVADVSDVLDMSTVHPSTGLWEEQAGFYISFNTGLSVSEQLQWIQYVEAEGTATTDRQNDLTFTISI